MLFKIFKKIAGIFGFKLIDKDLVKNDRELSKYSPFSIDKTLEKLFSEKKIKHLVQIGSNDGKRFDSLNKFIKKIFTLCFTSRANRKRFHRSKK